VIVELGFCISDFVDEVSRRVVDFLF
jgi:hypothetical protein